MSEYIQNQEFFFSKLKLTEFEGDRKGNPITYQGFRDIRNKNMHPFEIMLHDLFDTYISQTKYFINVNNKDRELCKSTIEDALTRLEEIEQAMLTDAVYQEFSHQYQALKSMDEKSIQEYDRERIMAEKDGFEFYFLMTNLQRKYIMQTKDFLSQIQLTELESSSLNDEKEIEMNEGICSKKAIGVSLSRIELITLAYLLKETQLLTKDTSDYRLSEVFESNFCIVEVSNGKIAKKPLKGMKQTLSQLNNFSTPPSNTLIPILEKMLEALKNRLKKF